MMDLKTVPKYQKTKWNAQVHAAGEDQTMKKKRWPLTDITSKIGKDREQGWKNATLKVKWQVK